MSLRQVRQRCARLLDECDLPDGYDTDAFKDAVERRRGRPIRMVPREGMVGPCGVLVSLPDTDYVFYESGTSPLHRDHIVAHELGHLLCDHVPQQEMDDAAIRSLMPDLDPAMVRAVLARTTYGRVEEQEAEMVASLALGLRAPTSSANEDDLIARLSRTLGADGS